MKGRVYCETGQSWRMNTRTWASRGRGWKGGSSGLPARRARRRAPLSPAPANRSAIRICSWPPHFPHPADGKVTRVYLPCLAVHVVYQKRLPQRAGPCEVCLAAADFRHLLHKLDQGIIARQHERVDQNTGATAACHFFERPRDDQRIEPEGIPVDAPVLERQGRRLAVGNHDDLAHVLALALQDSP